MLKSEEIKELFAQFENVSAEIEGVECWSARELQKLLGYTLWQNFEKVLVKAKSACENVGEEVSNHFIDVNKMVEIGSGAHKQIKDLLLTRYACYLVDVDDKGFAIIRSKGDKALFRLDTAQLKRKMGVPQSRPIADFLPTISIKAKDFAAAMTTENVQIKDLHGVPSIEKEHIDNNLGVRKIMIERGLVPENLPPAEDVQKVERRLKTKEKKVLKK